MGAWGTGPFDNDDAADFATSLDHLQPDLRVGAIRDALTDALEQTDYLDRDVGGAAVAAAALVAAQGGNGLPIDCIHGPKQLIPELSSDLRPIAALALVRVLGECSELNELWIDSPDGEAWLHMVAQLTEALSSAPVQQDC
ncbi:MAG TPA: DUF4259 domain-containing protein [Pseudonocardiaceae bacterium]|jgi:hypothetical protein